MGTVFSMFSINFIGVQLENPFGNDENDLPLDYFQGEMNRCLLMLLHDGSDIIAGVSPTRCIRDFELLADTLEEVDRARASIKGNNITASGSTVNSRSSVSSFTNMISDGIHSSNWHDAVRQRS